jgi:hypothetical protein
MRRFCADRGEKLGAALRISRRAAAQAAGAAARSVFGEINDTQALAWRKSIAAADAVAVRGRSLRGAAAGRVDCAVEAIGAAPVACTAVGSMLACVDALAQELRLDGFWQDRLAASRKGTRWDQVFFVRVAYRLLAPGTEWRLHREWFERSAMAGLLGEDAGLAEIHKLYGCHDRLLKYKQTVFDHLVGRWRDLFSQLRRGAIRSDEHLLRARSAVCGGRQASLGLLARSSLGQRPGGDRAGGDAGGTAVGRLRGDVGQHLGQDDAAAFLDRIERQYGKARRTWLMDRGIPTEEVLEQMRRCDPPVQYLVGTPKGSLREGSAREALAERSPWGPGEAAAAGRRTLCLCQEHRSRRQGARCGARS